MAPQKSWDPSRADSSPDRLLDARFAALDSVLWVEFADGLTRAVRWGDLSLARELVGFTPVEASVWAGGGALTLASAAEIEITVDAGTLRACLDEEHRARIESEDAGARRAVGARLRAARESLGIGQKELALRSGIAQESLSRMETGRQDPRLGTLQKLAKGMGLSLDEFLELMGR